MSVKFSEIADGGQYVPATDQIMAVRSGTTDVLLENVAAGPGASTAHHMAAFSGTDGATLEDSGILTSLIALLSGTQVFTGAKTFTNSLLKLLGSSTGATTFTSDNAGATNYTMHVPAANDTLAVLGTAQAITALKTFTNSMIALLGSSTGKTTFTSDNSSGTDYVMHVPAANDTLVTLAASQALTNKTLTSPTINLATLTLAAAQVGTFTANGVTPVTVTKAAVTANSTIIITLKTVGGTVGAIPAIQTITPTTGFTVAATVGDTSVYNYAIIG